MEERLQVRFTFDDDLMKKNEIERRDVYYTLKKNFTQRGLVCISEDDVLMFQGTGHEDDYGNIWAILMALIEGDWFTKCAASCDYIENGKVEDVLSQVPKARKMLGLAEITSEAKENKNMLQEDDSFMEKLQVRFTFDDDLMKRNEIERRDVYYTLKKNFTQRGLVCISEDDVLMFQGTGHEDDYGNIWAILMALIKSDWFTKCAASCDYIEDGEVEDVLSQVPKARKMLGLAEIT